nr:transcription factor IIIB 90 kDa subunit isoform X3 [Syngnathus scovelli]
MIKQPAVCCGHRRARAPPPQKKKKKKKRGDGSDQAGLFPEGSPASLRFLLYADFKTSAAKLTPAAHLKISSRASAFCFFCVFLRQLGAKNTFPLHAASSLFAWFCPPQRLIRLPLRVPTSCRCSAVRELNLRRMRHSTKHASAPPTRSRPVSLHPAFRSAAGVRRQEPRRGYDGAEAGAEDEAGLDAHRTEALRTLRGRSPGCRSHARLLPHDQRNHQCGQSVRQHAEKKTVRVFGHAHQPADGGGVHEGGLGAGVRSSLLHSWTAQDKSPAEAELTKKMDDIEGEIESYQDQIESELESSRPKLKGIYAAYTKQDFQQHVNEALGASSEPEEEDQKETEEDKDVLEAVAKHFGKDLAELTLEKLIELEQIGGASEDPHRQEPKRKGPTLASILGASLPTAASLGLNNSCSKEEQDDETSAEGGELDLSGIDDREIELYLLSEKEIKVKTALWMAENSDYLKEQKEKEAKIAKEKELGIYKEKKKRVTAKRVAIRADTADEAIEMMLEQKKISSKINYDVLKHLNIKNAVGPAPKSPRDLETGMTGLNGRYQRPGRASFNLSTPLSSLGKRLQPFVSGRPGKKMAVQQPSCTVPVAVAAPAPPSVLVESGPVAYDDPAGEEDEDDEEDACVSVIELMGSQANYGCDDYDDGF